MAKEAAIRCLVCGVETRNTCSACRRAGIELGFCTPEHQRIVWSTHKKCCGPRANPFLWPVLSMEEAADAEANVHYRVNDPDYPNFPSLAQCLRKDAGLPEESLPRMFRMLQEEHDKEKHGMPLRLHQYLLGQVRLFEMQRFNDIRQQTRAIRSTPFHLATMTSLDLLGLDADLHRFSSLVKHRLLAIYTVSRAIQTRKIPIAPGPWREDAMSVVLGSIDTEEFDAVPDAEKASIRQYFARHAPLQRMVSSFPDRPE